MGHPLLCPYTATLNFPSYVNNIFRLDLTLARRLSYVSV